MKCETEKYLGIKCLQRSDKKKSGEREREQCSAEWEGDYTTAVAYYCLLFTGVQFNLPSHICYLLYLPLHHRDTLRTVSPLTLTSQLWSSTFIVTFNNLLNILTLKEISENDKDHRFIMYFVDIEFVLAEIGGLCLYCGNLWPCWCPSRPAEETAEWQPRRWGDKHPCETPAATQSLYFPIQTSPEVRSTGWHSPLV